MATPLTDTFYANPPENEEAYQFACKLEAQVIRLRTTLSLCEHWAKYDIKLFAGAPFIPKLEYRLSEVQSALKS